MALQWQHRIFSFPGLDVIGNAGNNNYFGPFFNTDLALTKAFGIHAFAGRLITSRPT
jgi:hypothetical protein